MPGLVGNPPLIMTPGRGPNGPGPIDCRKPETSVGFKSSCPYGPTNGYANPGKVTGFIGPAAESLRQPTNWYVRIGGSNDNGGTDTGLVALRGGTDGVTLNTLFTSASGNFTSADVGRGICFPALAGANRYRKIAAVTSSTTITLDSAAGSNTSGVTWNIGGAWANTNSALTATSSAITSGDTVYIGAGVYRVTTALSNAAPNAAYGSFPFNGIVNIIGDVTGQYTGDAGMVRLTGYTTDDKTVASSTTLLNLNGKSNLTFRNINFMETGTTLITATTTTSQNISFIDCTLFSRVSNLVASVTSAGGQQFNWLIDRCFIVAGLTGFTFTAPTVNAPDYDVNVTIKNSIFHKLGTGTMLVLTSSGSLSGKSGGIRAFNCTSFTHNSNFMSTSANSSTIFPCLVYNSFFTGNTAVILNNASIGMIVEDYNLFTATTGTNGTAGAHSISDGSYAPLFHFGQEAIWGGLPRPFGEPMAGSPLLGFGNSGYTDSYDLLNRPRPAGANTSSQLAAVGALERGSTATQGTSPVPPTGTYTWQDTGRWYQDFLLPVSNASTTVSVVVQRDSAYSVPPWITNPAMLILANGKLGISAQTIVDSGAVSQWNTLTSDAFTPSGFGWVTVRIVSYDATDSSVVSFANISVT